MSTGRAADAGRTIAILLVGGVFGFVTGAALAVIVHLEQPSPLLAAVPENARAVVQVRSWVERNTITTLLPLLPTRLFPSVLPPESVWALVPSDGGVAPLVLSADGGLPLPDGWTRVRQGSVYAMSPDRPLLQSWQSAGTSALWRERFQPVGVRRRAAQSVVMGYVDTSFLAAWGVSPRAYGDGAYIALQGRGADARLVIDQQPQFFGMPLRFPAPSIRTLDAAAYDIVLSGQGMDEVVIDEHLIGTDPFLGLLDTTAGHNELRSLFAEPVSIGIRTGDTPVVTLLWSARSARGINARQEAAARVIDRAAQLHAPVAESATLSDGSAVHLLRPRQESLPHQSLTDLPAGWTGWMIVFETGEEWRFAWNARGTILASTDQGAFVQALGPATAHGPTPQPSCQIRKGPRVITVKLPLLRAWFPSAMDLPAGSEKDSMMVLESGWRPDLATICVR